MDSETKFKVIFENVCDGMQSFDAIMQRLNELKNTGKLFIMANPENDCYEPQMYISLRNPDKSPSAGDPYLKIRKDYMIFKVFHPSSKIMKSGYFFRNDGNREYYDKIIDFLWESK